MKNHRDLIGLAANILVVVVILLGIVLGLNSIGVYDLPAPIEKLLGNFNNDQISVFTDEEKVYNSLEFNQVDNTQAKTATLSYENARTLLENVIVGRSYSHELVVRNYYDGRELIERYVVSNKNNNFDVSVYDNRDVLVKTISTKDGYVYISNNTSIQEQQDVINLPSASFSVSDECGFILTHSDFLDSDFPLDSSTFSLKEGEYGAELIVEFDSSIENYTQKQIYTISLDYGIVVFAECFENQKLVFKMDTVSLHEVN